MSFESAVSVLAGNDREFLKTNVVVLLTQRRKPVCYEEIRDLCLKCHDYEDVATVVVAVAAFNPAVAGQWLEIVAPPLWDDDCPEAFAAGIILGIFQAGKWLNSHKCGECQSFNDKWPVVVANIISSRFGLVSLEKDAFCHIIPVEKYRGQLSEAIKTFVRFGAPITGPHAAQTAQLFKAIADKDDHVGAGICQVPIFLDTLSVSLDS